jgi:two-component system sensor histidine kinase UhpB
MSEATRRHDEQCLRALRAYLAGGGEAALHAAYEVGREALENGLGVLDLTGVLQRALIRNADGDHALARQVEEVEPFVFECYSPYEMAHRGMREANSALRRINERREEEIKRLAHELHDEAGQMLAAVYLALDAVAGDVAPEGHGRFQTVRARLRDVEVQLRRISHEMRPLMLDDLGLVPALRFLGEGVAKRSGLAVRVEASADERMHPAVETALYRCAQEALTNVVRHARAARVTLRLERRADRVAMIVSDDGVGFDPRTLHDRGGHTGLGIIGIRERVESLAGTVEIRSDAATGTDLTIDIPLRSPVHAAHPVG